MKYRLVAIDGNYLAFLSWALAQKNEEDDNLSCFIMDFFERLAEIKKQFDSHFTVLVWDHPKGSNRRRKISEKYKSTRPKKPDGFFDAIKKAKIGISNTNIMQATSRFGEGDDVIFTLSRKYKGTLIWSADKDFLQIIDENTHQWRHHSQRLITLSNIEQQGEDKKISGLRPKGWHDYQILCGDSADDIAGLKGVGPKRAKKILDKIVDFVDFALNPEKHEELILHAKTHGKEIFKYANQAISEVESLKKVKELVELYEVPIEIEKPIPSKELFFIFLAKFKLEHKIEELYQ